MLAKRVLVAVILLPIGVAAIYLGGWYFNSLVLVFMCLAAWEYTQLFRSGGFQPAIPLVIAGAFFLVGLRAWKGFEYSAELISFLILASMTYHLVAYERGQEQSGTDFGITLGGLFYLGWIGAYLISLRSLPNGAWWVLLVLPSVWIADSGAYFIGRAFGRHRFSPRLSPKKTWEGYFAGVIAGSLGGALLAYLWGFLAGPEWNVSPWLGALLGFLLAVLTPLGDLGESMFKRQVGAKDSGKLLPGHGGIFDRIDSWLWAAVIGYYLANWLAR